MAPPRVSPNSSSPAVHGCARSISPSTPASPRGPPSLGSTACMSPFSTMRRCPSGDRSTSTTAFAATGSRLSARRFWLAHAADANGRLWLDDGAVTAVVERRRSLLAAGITSVEGAFDGGDVVELVDPAGVVVARGVVAYDASELPELIGRSSHELPPEQRREVVHADDLVPLR